MIRRKEIPELAALLDGELDAHRANELYEQIQADPNLRAEYEMQRETKLALGKLPDVAAPDFMTTRIMGEIAARRGEQTAQHSAWRWRTIAAAVGGFAVCLLLVMGVMYTNTLQQTNLAPTTLADRNLDAERFAATRGNVLPLDSWGELTIPAGADDSTADFLRFANDAHNYSRMTNTTREFTPDVTRAIQVLDGKVIVILDGEVYTFEDEHAKSENTRVEGE